LQEGHLIKVGIVSFTEFFLLLLLDRVCFFLGNGVIRELFYKKYRLYTIG